MFLKEGEGSYLGFLGFLVIEVCRNFLLSGSIFEIFEIFGFGASDL